MADEIPGKQGFFMRIDSPNVFRKNLLETSKITLNILKQIYVVKNIRKAKHELISRISNEIRELKILAQKIDELMPQHKKDDLKKVMPKHHVVEEAPVGKKSKSKKVHKKHFSDVEKITKALDAVHKKLQSI